MKVLLELRHRLLVNPSAALVRLDPPIGLPDQPTWRSQTTSASARSPGSSHVNAVGRQAQPGRPFPFAPAPLQDLQRYYGSVRPCAPHHYSPPRRSAAWGSRSRRPAAGPNRSTGRPPHRGDRFPRSAQEPGPRSRHHLVPDTRLANQQAPARLLPGQRLDTRFRMSPIRFRHFIGGSLSLAFVIHT